MSRLGKFNDIGRHARFDAQKPTPEDMKKLDTNEKNLSELGQNYMNDLRKKSEYPQTLKDTRVNPEEWRKISPEDSRKMREDFNSKRDGIKHDWEDKNGMSWPKYSEDVYSPKGIRTRRKGQDYDAHHIQPLSCGGKNEVSNITPLHSEAHKDIHAPDGSCGKIQKEMDK